MHARVPTRSGQFRWFITLLHQLGRNRSGLQSRILSHPVLHARGSPCPPTCPGAPCKGGTERVPSVEGCGPLIQAIQVPKRRVQLLHLHTCTPQQCSVKRIPAPATYRSASQVRRGDMDLNATHGHLHSIQGELNQDPRLLLWRGCLQTAPCPPEAPRHHYCSAW